jgi:UDP-N-acetylmuramoyl-tripeptide--D-alanyl-D-alanine ligase
VTQPLWTAGELWEATGGHFTQPFDAVGVSIDTRTLQVGEMFIALLGEGRDGHAFVADAAARGGAGAMVHDAVGVTGPALLQVDDTLAALTRLGGFARDRFAGRVVAITGSVGKTTTKEMLRVGLSAYGPTHAAAASYNNHWGVPLTLARTPREAAFAVLEIGMNHPGEIAPLSRLAQPDVAVITTVAKAHVGHLGSIEAIADEKASILHGLAPGGSAVLPADSPWLPRLRSLAGGARVLTFGTDCTADARLLRVQPDAEGSVIGINVAGHTVTFRLSAPGSHMAMNAAAMLAAVAALGLDPNGAVAALEAFRPLAGRGARRTIMLAGGPALLLDESYNANGASALSALEVLRLQSGGRRIAVLGDMLELGAEGQTEHGALAAPVADAADLVFTCGPLMAGLFGKLPGRLRGAHAADAGMLAPIVARAIRSGDVILVKGSLGSGMKRVIEAIEACVPAQQAAGGG